MNNVKELLPIGSVVLLEGGEKKLMVFGIKQTDQESQKEYDYIGVIYPEGNIGPGGQFFFNHVDIAEVIFKGYSNNERDLFIERLYEHFERHPAGN
mgnify:CR=1 FL=1